ncbi:MAG: hypothetical protein HY071_05105 [Chloroflexi bacterium]|nr:hypothetical protein [Chloroflexota bacterium]
MDLVLAVAIIAAVALVIPGVILIRRALRARTPDLLSKLGSRQALGGFALLVVAVFVAGTPFVLREQTKQCIREETSNILVGRVSQARQICVEYGDGSSDSVRADHFDIRFVPSDPDRDAPFTIVVVGHKANETVKVAISPLGVNLQPATLVANSAGEARTDFRIPSGASPEWIVLATRDNGDKLAVQIPLPPNGSDPLGRVTRPPFNPPTPDPSVTVSTCAPSPAPIRTIVRCTFVGLGGPYASFSRRNVATGETLDLRFIDVVRPDGRTVYQHTYFVDPGTWEITATTPTGSSAAARFTVTAN